MEESLETLRARVAAKRAKLAELTKAVDDCNAETERLKNSNVEEGAKQDKLMQENHEAYIAQTKAVLDMTGKLGDVAKQEK